jgi:hypothetical protein
MLARFRVLLPFAIELDSTADLRRDEWTDGVTRFVVHPPLQAALKRPRAELEQDDPDAIMEGLRNPPSRELGKVQFVEGGKSIRSDMLQVDLWRTEFERPKQGPYPVVDECFALVNSLLERLRLITRSSSIRRLDRGRAFWVIEYLNDDETPVAESPDLARGTGTFLLPLRMASLTKNIWDRALALPRDFSVSRSVTLLLDAMNLAETGPSLVLAAAAIETRVEDVVGALARGSLIPPELWSWLMDRGDFRKDPSTEEQLTVLLRSLGGRSLKDDPALWEAFVNIRDARNSYVHEGRSIIGRNRAPVTRTKMASLLGKCEEILEWLDQLVPEESRALPRRERADSVRAWGISAIPPGAIYGLGNVEDVDPRT